MHMPSSSAGNLAGNLAGHMNGSIEAMSPFTPGGLRLKDEDMFVQRTRPRVLLGHVPSMLQLIARVVALTTSSLSVILFVVLCLTVPVANLDVACVRSAQAQPPPRR